MWLKNYDIIKLHRMTHSWIKPEGYDTGIKLFNCITKAKEPFMVRNKNLITWYTCGPTVYDSSHVGHACCFVKLDIIQRVLRSYFGLNLVTVMNVTDIDDKIISRANVLKVSTKEVSDKYEKEFWSDLGLLNVVKPDCVLRVTENIPLIQDFIRNLIERQQAYKSNDDSVYFDVNKYGNYGKLQNISEESQNEANAITGRKRAVMDFALWKSQKPGEIAWNSPWGPGRPGWHIECSALASHAFGSCIDIHAGGVDLRFPHHENEEAQSCSFHNTPQWVNYWLHTGHLHLKHDATKMSKSLKNTISIQELLTTTPVDVFRLACVMSHYRTDFEYSAEFLTTARNVLRNYKNFADTCQNYSKGLLKISLDSGKIIELLNITSEKIHEGLQDDICTPTVIGALNELVSGINAMIHSAPTSLDHNFSSGAVIGASHLLTRTLGIFGMNISSKSDQDQISDVATNFNDVMDILNQFRQEVRSLGISEKNGNILKLCDGARNDLKKYNIEIKDHGIKSTWSV